MKEVKMNNLINLKKGFFKENPVFVQLLGMCPTLGVTSTAINGLGMGLATLFVLVMSNIAIALVTGLIPSKVRIPAFIIIIASFVTVVDLVMAGFFNSLHEQLGLFIPLIVVNCIVLGRAEAFASKNSVISSMFDGLGMGLGFTMALVMLGSVRELFGSLSIFGFQLFETDGALVFVLAPGAFIALGLLIALVNAITKKVTP
jgi:electron transport complex protein RnfE